METLLILGANGFIGKHLLKKLMGQYNIIAADLNEPDLAYVERYSFVYTDFTKVDNFEKLLNGVDKVVHLIGTTTPIDSTDNVLEEINNNVLPTVKMLEAIKSSSVKEVLFASSAGTVYGDTDVICDINQAKNPICSYGIMKSTIEDLIKLYSKHGTFKAKIMRLSNPYGFDENNNKTQGVIPIFIRKNLSGLPIHVFGDTERDYIYIDDLITGIEKTISYSGEEVYFQLCTGKSYKLSYIINLIEAITGREFIVKIGEMRGCDVEFNRLNSIRTQRLLGWSPTVTIEDGTNLLINMFKRIYK